MPSSSTIGSYFPFCACHTEKPQACKVLQVVLSSMALAIASTALTSLPTRSTSVLSSRLRIQIYVIAWLCREIIFINFQCSLFGNREVHPRIFPGKFTTCLPGRTRRANATKGVSSVCEPLPPDRPLWFPGSSPPEWLDGRYLILVTCRMATFQLLSILVNYYLFCLSVVSLAILASTHLD